MILLLCFRNPVGNEWQTDRKGLGSSGNRQDRWERPLGRKPMKCGDHMDEALRMTPKLWSA